MVVYSNMTIVAIISPIPENKPGISVFRIIAFRIIPFRYWRSLVALSRRGPTTIPSLEKLSHAGKSCLSDSPSFGYFLGRYFSISSVNCSNENGFLNISLIPLPFICSKTTGSDEAVKITTFFCTS